MMSQPPKNYWLLIDAPDTKPAEINARLADMTFNYWYENTHLFQALDASPLWIKVERLDGEFAQKYTNAPVFTTAIDDEQFIKYVKSLVLMLGPDKKPYAIRFYTPDYLTHWLAELAPDRRDWLLGPIEEVKWQYNDQEHNLVNSNSLIATPEKDLAWFQLTETEWELMKQAYKNRGK